MSDGDRKRSVVLRMSGNIAAGLAQAWAGDLLARNDLAATHKAVAKRRDDIAEMAVDIAERIYTKVHERNPTR